MPWRCGQILLIDADVFLDALEPYLYKHHFCRSCKDQVLRAFDVLVGYVDEASEPGFIPELYTGLRRCPGMRHFHVSSSPDILSLLMGKGLWREHGVAWHGIAWLGLGLATSRLFTGTPRRNGEPAAAPLRGIAWHGVAWLGLGVATRNSDPTAASLQLGMATQQPPPCDSFLTTLRCSCTDRVEPDCTTERHAATMEGAQEEVLTCLGLFLWDRLQQLWQRMRSEEQTWQLLLHLSTMALRQRFELAVEQKQGELPLRRWNGHPAAAPHLARLTNRSHGSGKVHRATSSGLAPSPLRVMAGAQGCR